MIKKKAAPAKPINHVEGCIFTGVHWDAKAVQTIQTIADGFLQNAKGMTALAEILKSQNISIETMLKIGE